MKQVKLYGCTYSTEKHNFGETLEVFEVPADWQGFRHHGYAWATSEEVAGLELACCQANN